MRTIALAVFACLAGIGIGELIFRSTAGRDLIGRFFGRGHLVALVDDQGIYQIDLRREIMADHFAAGLANVSADEEKAPDETKRVANRLVIKAVTRTWAENEIVPAAELRRECDLLRSQFSSARAFARVLKTCGFSNRSLRVEVADNLKTRHWFERQLAAQMKITDEECREFYRVHGSAFVFPLRFRASHLFLAAPPETPPEVVEAKRAAIETYSKRLTHGEDFGILVAEGSEDETTRQRGGDLGFFSLTRMLPEFVAPVMKMRVGETSKPFRTYLGFHIARLTGVEPVRQIPWQEAHSEIIGILQNEKRRTVVAKLAAAMMQRKFSGLTQ